MQTKNRFAIQILASFLFIILPLIAVETASAQPSVTTVIPSPNALNAAPSAALSCTFNADMNMQTVTNHTVRVTGSVSGLHSCAFSYDAGSRTVMITPDRQFEIGETVVTTVTRGVKNMNGDTLTNSFSWSFTVRTNPASGLFQAASTVNVGDAPWCLTAADFDKDGSIDLAVVNNYDNSISILKNDGTGRFANQSTIPAGSYPGSIITSDLDADGDMDLVVTNANSVVIFKNDGHGTFAQTSSIFLSGTPWYSTAADFDGNGTIDLAVTNYTGQVYILMNDGNGSFTRTSTIEQVGAEFALAAADVNNDGASDLIVTNTQLNTVSILMNNGRGQFAAPSFATVGDGPLAVAAQDLNGDGLIDLAVANYHGNSVSILKNTGGTFTTTSTVNTDSNPTSVIAVDVDGNGAMDLAVVCAGSATVVIYTNDGTGTFTRASTMRIGEGSSSRIITAADLNRDGKIDLAVVNLQSDNVTILKNRPANASIDVEPTTLDFGVTDAGSTKSLFLRISNAGTDSMLIIRSIVSSNSAFTASRESLMVMPSGVDSVQIVFSPVRPNFAYRDSLLIATTDPAQPIVTISLKGVSSFNRPTQALVLARVGGPIYAGISILSDDVMYAVATGDAVYRMNTSGAISYNLQVGGDIRSSSSIASDTTVYIASSDRNLYAFSKDGNSLWSLPAGGTLTATPVVDSIANRLYIGVANKNFIAVNRTTGRVDWNYFADDQIKQSAVVTSDRRLVFVSNKGTLYGFNLNAIGSPAAPDWKIALPDTAPASMAVDADGNLYVGSGAGNLLKITLQPDGRSVIQWKTPIGAAITTTPVIDRNGTIYVGSVDSKFRSIDPQSGAINWTFTTNAPIKSSPAISDIGTLYVANDNGEIYAMDANKNVLWRYLAGAPIAAPLLHYKSHLYAGTLGNEIIRLTGIEDSVGVSPSRSLNGAVQNSSQPMWSTFQGNSRRTGMASLLKVTGVGSGDVQPPQEFSLSQNYPNPFNPTTTIKYQIPAASYVSMKIFDILGREAASLVNEVKSAGTYAVQWDAAAMPSGIYIYTIRSGNYHETKRMILLR
jgi:outer membrane protein assembly factor BamB